MKRITHIVSAHLVCALLFALMPTIALAADAPNDFANAQPIKVNTSYSDNISDAKDHDYFRFSLTGAGTIDLTFTRKNLVDKSEYWGIEIYNEKTEQICFYSIDGLSASSTTYTIGLDRGTYYIRVHGGNYSSGYSYRYVTDIYTLRVNFKAANCEHELNEQPADATSIALNTSYVGSINSPRDADYYKFFLSQAGTINLTFDRNKLSYKDEYWGIEIYNEKTEQICFYSIDGLSASSTTYTVGLDRGTYYIKVHGGNYSSGYSYRYVTDIYTLRVNFKAANCEHELNEQPANATNIALDTSYVGSINSPRDADYYQVILPRTGVLDLTFNRNNLENAAEYWRIAIYNDQTKQLCSFSVNGLSKSSTFRTETLVSGTYYIRICGGDYSSGYSYRFVTNSYSFALSMQCAGESSCPSRQFTDVPKPGHWAHAGIDFALKRGLFAGTSQTKFSPNSPMTRAMLVTVLWRLDGKPAPKSSNKFSDVKNGQWYTDAIRWASEKNVVSGVGNNKFNPNGNVTREQMAAILFRYAKMKGYDVADRSNLNSFPDVSQVSAYAKDALSWANVNGLISGTTQNGTVVLNPRGNATRAQVASILMRYVQNIVEG